MGNDARVDRCRLSSRIMAAENVPFGSAQGTFSSWLSSLHCDALTCTVGEASAIADT